MINTYLNAMEGVRTDNTGRSVPNLVVLALGELDKEFGDLVLDFHLPENSGTVVGHGDVSIC